MPRYSLHFYAADGAYQGSLEMSGTETQARAKAEEMACACCVGYAELYTARFADFRVDLSPVARFDPGAGWSALTGAEA